MTDIHSSLSGLIQRELTLSQKQIESGSKSHQYIRNLLVNKHSHDARFPLFVEGDFLSGSYARGTKLHPLDDIDVIMVLDGSGLFAIKDGARLDADVRGNNVISNPVSAYFGADGMLDSQKVLDVIAKALRVSHPSSTVRKDGQAINVKLASGIGIDVVPAFHIIPRDGSQDFYYIPKGYGSFEWMTTNPKLDMNISDRYHKAHNELGKGIVRLAKYWNEVSNAGRLRSYHVETAVWHTLDKCNAPIQSYEEGLLHFFQHAPEIVAVPCVDKTMLGGPVDSYLTHDNRASSVDAVNEAVASLSQVYLFGSDEENRVRAWNNLFNGKLQ